MLYVKLIKKGSGCEIINYELSRMRPNRFPIGGDFVKKILDETTGVGANPFYLVGRELKNIISKK